MIAVVTATRIIRTNMARARCPSEVYILAIFIVLFCNLTAKIQKKNVLTSKKTEKVRISGIKLVIL